MTSFDFGPQCLDAPFSEDRAGTLPPHWIEATICAGGRETIYRRAGSGAPVLLLRNSAPQVATPLTGALAMRARVIVPLAPPAVVAQRDTRWLLDLLDALAVEAATLLGDASTALLILAFAATHPDRTERIVLLAPPMDEPATVTTVLAQHDSPHRVPLHLVPHGAHSTAEVSEVLRVIAGGDTPLAG